LLYFYIKESSSVGGRTSAKRKGLTGTILGNQARSKRIYKYKAIVERKQATDKTIIKCRSDRLKVYMYKNNNDIQE
jgi:hypothetical protein